jgi:hypothetical protein
MNVNGAEVYVTANVGKRGGLSLLVVDGERLYRNFVLAPWWFNSLFIFLLANEMNDCRMA